MAFREKLKRVLSRSTNNTTNSNGASSPTRSTSTSSRTTSSRKPSNIYGPDEKIPYKYRRPVAKEHKDKLEAFSFATAWRKGSAANSVTGWISPSASRAPSRRGSLTGSIGRGGFTTATTATSTMFMGRNRPGSVGRSESSVSSSGGGPISGNGIEHAARRRLHTQLSTAAASAAAAEGATGRDFASASASGAPSAPAVVTAATPSPVTETGIEAETDEQRKLPDTPLQDDSPFTPDDLTRAMQQSDLNGGAS